MTSEEPDNVQLASLDSRTGHYSENSALKAEISQLQAELVDLKNILLAHRECCGSSRVCPHSKSPPCDEENTTASN
ncbi:hypothetical protein BGZ61DRAFT_376825 [Ilyonectria robusta]|uniref:uncharacterized protein n=1 Tax=Ilyonectria robusta TaxID=1079257 RepID=UPI001E8D9598|nr:uncharacterized protein BGZ61DRAFT_376825 [Ilyonectria robusta]KAH8646438.1 hypothetical protein BGZ61DRAFT_376825 [Ilyonectria robusta]